MGERDLEKDLERLTLLWPAVDELVEAEEVRLGSAVNVVPPDYEKLQVVCHQDVNSPVTDEVLLIEDGPIRAEESCGAAVLLAHIERLQKGSAEGQTQGKRNLT